MIIDTADEVLHLLVDIVAAMARLIYKPFGIIAGLIAARLAATLFDVIWQKVDRSGLGAPKPTQRDTSTTRAVSAAAIEAATFAGTKVVVDRAGLRTFEHLTGAWAGAKPPKTEAEQTA